jgi:hypothetical protein
MFIGGKGEEVREMKKSLLPLVLMAAVLLAGTAFTCKEIIRSADDDCSRADPPLSYRPDYPTRICGTVYFHQIPQAGATVFLTRQGGGGWQTKTGGDGKYKFNTPGLGSYTIKASYDLEWSPSGHFEVRRDSPDPIRINLYIGGFPSHDPDPVIN